MNLACCLVMLLGAIPEDGGIVPESVTDAGVPDPVLFDGAELSARFGEGVTFKQGAFKLNLRGRMQVQGQALFPTEGSDAERQNSIFIRRARVVFRGEFPLKLSFHLELSFTPLEAEPDVPSILRDATVQWAPLRDLSFRLGQMKVPFDVQRITSSSTLQLVDRSLVTGELNLDRDVGLVAFSDDLFGWNERLRYAVGVFGGDGRNRLGGNVGLLYAGRVRFSPLGAFDDRVEGDPDRDPTFRFALGGGLGRNVQTNRPRSTTGTPYEFATFNYTHATGDLHVKWRGLSLLSEIYWRQADSDSVTRVDDGVSLTEFSRSGWGWFAQAGYYLTSWLEVAARYGDLRPFANTDPDFKRTIEAGGAINVFFWKHDLKLQTDFFWVGEEGKERLQLRIQAQVYF